MRATKLIHGFKGLSYSERLKKLNLPTLKYRRLRGDIELFKMSNGMYSTDACIKFNFVDREVNRTRGNKLKIFQGHVQYNLRKYFFSNRVIQIWNSLPDFIIEANNINSFKNKLDKHWANQNFKFNWRSDLTGSGSNS